MESELAAAGEAEVAPFGDLGVVVAETDGAEAEEAEERDPDVGVVEVGPEEGGHDDGDDDQDAAHGGGAGFLLVRLGAFLADVLADLEIAQVVDHPGAEGDAKKERGEAGAGGAEGGVAEDAERA